MVAELGLLTELITVLLPLVAALDDDEEEDRPPSTESSSSKFLSATTEAKKKEHLQRNALQDNGKCKRCSFVGSMTV